MPLIKPRTRGKQMVRHRTRLDRETNETMYAYAHFIGEPTEYVLNQMIDTLLAKDREFLQWRATHPESYAPRRRAHSSGRARRRIGAADPRAQGAIHDSQGRPSPCREGDQRSMIRALLEGRLLVAVAVAAGVGTYGVRAYPVRGDEVFLAVIAARRADLFAALAHGYAVLWFTTPFCVASLLASLFAIAAYRAGPSARVRPLPPYPEPETRPTPTLVLGEIHHPTKTGRAAHPSWLIIPQRGLYTGVMILVAGGTGKTSACMYPYLDQLLR